MRQNVADFLYSNFLGRTSKKKHPVHITPHNATLLSSGVTSVPSTRTCTPTTRARAWTSSLTSSTRSRRGLTTGGSCCAPGTPQTWTRWRCRPATASSSSTWLTASCPASSTSARPTWAWGCPSTSPGKRELHLDRMHIEQYIQPCLTLLT